jgi:hypothetical protein
MNKITIVKIFIIVVILLGLVGANTTASIAAATVYYVATTGSDSNPGTIDKPWLTIQHAVDIVIAGDTVYIRAGTYHERVQALSGNGGGSNKGYIAYRNYPNETVILDGTGIALSHGEGLFYIRASNYIRVSGLRVENSNSTGIFVGNANNVIVENNYTYNSASSGVGIWGSSYVTAIGNEISAANMSGSEENISIDSSNNVEVAYNSVHNGGPSSSGGEGINIKNGSHDIKVHNNIVHDQPKLAFGVDAWTAHTYNLEIYNNIAYNAPHGFIVSSEQGGALDHVKVYNNVAYNINGDGFSFPNWTGTKDGHMSYITFINNDSYNNSTGFLSRTINIDNVVISNNIFSGNRTQITLQSEANITIDHNLFYGNTSSHLGTNYIVGNPMFVNAPADFHLQAGSPAIDAGTSLNAPSFDFDGVRRPQGSGYDIGAYEYHVPYVPNCHITYPFCTFSPLVEKK